MEIEDTHTHTNTHTNTHPHQNYLNSYLEETLNINSMKTFLKL
jgi:hypothetical protein